MSSVLQAPPASGPRLLLAEEMSRRRRIKPVPSVAQQSKLGQAGEKWLLGKEYLGQNEKKLVY